MIINPQQKDFSNVRKSYYSVVLSEVPSCTTAIQIESDQRWSAVTCNEYSSEQQITLHLNVIEARARLIVFPLEAILTQ